MEDETVIFKSFIENYVRNEAIEIKVIETKNLLIKQQVDIFMMNIMVISPLGCDQQNEIYVVGTIIITAL